MLIGLLLKGTPLSDQRTTTQAVNLDELELLKQTLLWSDADTDGLRRAGAILAPRVEDVLDVWYGFVGAHDHLVATFAGADGDPDAEYLAAVRVRFAEWIVRICTATYDQTWLNEQHELGLRHHDTKKNQTDGVKSTSPHVPLRYLISIVVPLTVTVRDFLRSEASSDADLDEMHNAWFKAVTLTAALWARPYSTSW